MNIRTYMVQELALTLHHQNIEQVAELPTVLSFDYALNTSTMLGLNNAISDASLGYELIREGKEGVRLIIWGSREVWGQMESLEDDAKIVIECAETLGWRQ